MTSKLPASPSLEHLRTQAKGLLAKLLEATPHRINIDFVEGPEAGYRSEGIFELNGDSLTGLAGFVATGSQNSSASSYRSNSLRPASHSKQRIPWDGDEAVFCMAAPRAPRPSDYTRENAVIVF
jgi:hypothetical protein